MGMAVIKEVELASPVLLAKSPSTYLRDNHLLEHIPLTLSRPRGSPLTSKIVWR